jgi:light-regulated signal transduction histidine kinase (bacteriophytochrome)
MVRQNMDEAFCGKVPLHQTNAIQPHGALIITQKNDLKILQVSENVEQFFGILAPKMVNQSLASLVSAEQAQKIKDRFASSITGKIPFALTIDSKEFIAIVQEQDSLLLFEIEAVKDEASNNFIHLYEELRYAGAAIEATSNTLEACAVAAKELKRLSQFDKIMIYQFDPEWNGDVIAEEMEEGMESYMGLKFPASDIPKQARDLYRLNPYRIIPNVNYEPVRLYPLLNPVTNSFTNLSNCNLRSVAAVHLEYLRNMKVEASMSTRILKDGKLWGLIACHHRTPRYLSFEMCSLFELISNIVSAKIGSTQNTDASEYKSHMHQLHAQLVEDFYQSRSIAQTAYNHQGQLLELLKADGVAIVVNKGVEIIGATPDKNEIKDLVFWLQTNGIYKTYHQPSLPDVYEHAEEYAKKASGLLALPVQPEKGEYILAFRNEAVRKVNWGGNPNEAVQFEPNKINYHPRNSFKIWQETVQKTSLPWREEELEIAEHFRNFLIEFSLNNMQ